MKFEEIKKLECWHDGVFYTEEFKDLPGYEGVFKVSSFGRVWSCKRIALLKFKNGLTAPKETGGFFLSILEMKSGYKRVQLSHDGKKIKKVVHILVAQTFIPNSLNKECVNHKDLVKGNNFFKNLEWVTNRENSIHYFQTVSKTGRAGIHFRENRSRYSGLILHKGKRHNCGYHKTFELAEIAYNNKLKELGLS
jgi:hypothetical protein